LGREGILAVDAYEEVGGEWGALLDKEVAKLSGLLSN